MHSSYVQVMLMNLKNGKETQQKKSCFSPLRLQLSLYVALNRRVLVSLEQSSGM